MAEKQKKWEMLVEQVKQRTRDTNGSLYDTIQDLLVVESDPEFNAHPSYRTMDARMEFLDGLLFRITFADAKLLLRYFPHRDQWTCKPDSAGGIPDGNLTKMLASCDVAEANRRKKEKEEAEKGKEKPVRKSSVPRDEHNKVLDENRKLQLEKSNIEQEKRRFELEAEESKRQLEELRKSSRKQKAKPGAEVEYVDPEWVEHLEESAGEAEELRAENEKLRAELKKFRTLDRDYDKLKREYEQLRLAYNGVLQDNHDLLQDNNDLREKYAKVQESNRELRNLLNPIPTQ